MTRAFEDSVGVAGTPFRIVVESDRVHAFRRALGFDDKSVVHGVPAVPPTFLTTGGTWSSDPLELPRRAGLDVRRLIHAGFGVSFRRPLVVGEVLVAEPVITMAEVRKGRGGHRRWLEVTTTYRAEDGDVVATSRSTTVEGGPDAPA